MPLIFLNGQRNQSAVPSLFSTGVITIPDTQVAADHTDFVWMIDLSRMPASWWAQSILSDGGNIRVYEGTDDSSGTPLPFDIVKINTGAKTGKMFVKSNLDGDVPNHFFLAVEAGPTMPAVTDPIGRNAVWSDYACVFIASDTNPEKDRTGVNADLTFYNHTMSIVADGFDFDGTDDFAQSQISTPASSIFTMGCSFNPDITSGIDTMLALADPAEAAPSQTKRCSLVRANSALEFWNDSDNVINTDPASTGASSARRDRLVGRQNGNGGARQIHHNGIACDLDGTVTFNGWSGVGTLDVNIGCANGNNTAAPTENWDGKIDLVYVRPEYLSAEWITTEWNSWERNSTFVYAFDSEDIFHVNAYTDDNADVTTYTISNVVVGPHHTDRQIIAVATICGDVVGTPPTVSNVQINGSPATIDLQTSGGDHNRHIIVARGSPTTEYITFSLTLSAAEGQFIEVEFYVVNVPVTVHDSDVQTTTGSGSAASQTCTLDVPAGGFVLAATAMSTAASPSVAWSGTAGVTERSELTGGAFGGLVFLSSVAEKFASAGGSGLTVIATPNASQRMTTAAISYAA